MIGGQKCKINQVLVPLRVWPFLYNFRVCDSRNTIITRDRICMVQRVATVAFEGIEARAVDVQVQVAPGLPAFNIVGLPDKAVSEAKERVRAALVASGLALPARRITVNLAP